MDKGSFFVTKMRNIVQVSIKIFNNTKIEQKNE